jgi:hypothetical protein
MHMLSVRGLRGECCYKKSRMKPGKAELARPSERPLEQALAYRLCRGRQNGTPYHHLDVVQWFAAPSLQRCKI